MAEAERMGKRPARQDDAAASRWRVASLVVFIVAFGTTVTTLDDPGLTWDEPISIRAGLSYATWLGELPRLPFGREVITKYWQINREHPPLAKLLMGVSQLALGDRFGVLSSRLAVALLFALLVELVFRLGGSAFGGVAGLGAAASLVCMPRVFGHAHLAALDLAMAFTWLLSVAAFARAVERGGWRWGAVSGACFGLALLTKINAVFLPLALAGWGVGFHRKRAVRPLAWTLLGGAAVFLAGWPWLWHDTASRLAFYLRAPQRVSLPVRYFGRTFADAAAPWHYPVVMTAVTVPVGILFASVLGGVRGVREFRRQPLLALALINVAVVLGVFMVPGVPNYDGVRLFLPVFPFLALLAGVGVQNGWRWVARRSRSRPWRPLFLLVAFFLSQAGAIVLIHPYELSYYNALVGGLWGADQLGLETTYWHDPVNRAVFGWLNRRCVTNQAVAFYPVSEFAVVLPLGEAKTHVPNFYDFYLNAPDPSKRLRAERIDSGVPCGFLVLNAREAMLRRHEEAWRVWTSRPPVFAIRKQGVRLCAVFEAEPPRRRARRRAGE